MMNEIELRYGKGIKTEQKVIEECLNKINLIESVIHIGGLDFIHQYLRDRYMKVKENDK